ncbi:Ig domain-containing protein [Yersinia intermedia]|uniref:Invasin n=2 Tax=Yersinia intermedia TaxID=631 RepID=A0A0H5MH72_YERIN|nr:Ig domain-containing protein [Yersinia intermedia]
MNLSNYFELAMLIIRKYKKTPYLKGKNIPNNSIPPLRINWKKIALQLCFPIIISFTSTTMATTLSEGIATRPYVLSQGETTESIAKQYQLSINQLKDLNQSRVFKIPFDSLGAGDEIDIPKTPPLPSIQTGNDISTDTEMKLANGGMLSGEMLSKQDPTRYIGQKVKSSIINEANQSVQGWLNQFGTAQIQLNVDDDFNLDNSALDFLAPLYEQEELLLFTQLGVRNKDSRNTVNVGIGVRTHIGQWMYGINSFFDNDFTGHNQRFGVGTEVWTDYLKLSANSYFGITDWHQSRDFEHYNERPADGFDIRAEAYIPSYPQLGGKLMYEKYRGDEVALFGKDNRQKNPYAVTTGISYTPIPLVTLGVDHRVGQNSKNDTSMNLQFNYRLGEPWQKQIDPSVVAATRLLTGSRYDLVERNNNIVLDYQKQELIRLSLPTQLVGIEGDTAVLTAQVVAQHATDRIDWDAPSLIAAGGNISQLSSHVIQVTYPPYQVTRGINNTYTLSAVAHDIKGNASNRATTLIQVNPQDISSVNSILSANPVNIMANGSDTSIVTLTLKDSNNNPVPDQSVVFATTLGTINSAVESGHGIYTATLTAGTVTGIASVTARVNGNALGVAPTTITLSAGVIDIGRSTLAADPIAIMANGSDTSLVTLTLKDSHDNPVSGQNVAFTTTLGTLGSAVESGSGIYTATLTAGTVTGIASVTAYANSSALGIAPATITLSAGVIDISRSTLVADPIAIMANGSDTSLVTLTLKDSHDNPVSGQNVAFTTTLGTLGSAVESGSGIYTATLTAGTVSGIASVTAHANSSALGIAPATITLSAGVIDIGRSTLTADPIAIMANGSDTSLVTLTLKDSHDNPVSGQNVAFTTTLGTLGSAVESTSGIYTATLTAGTVTGIASVTAHANSSALSIAPASITLSAGAFDAMRSTLMVSTNTINADDRTGALITLIARDTNDNPISDLNITFTTDLINSQITNASQSGNSYVANIDGTKIGLANIGVKLSDTVVAGLAETLTITPGAWNQAQVPEILTLHAAAQQCVPTLNGNGFTRVILFVEALTLYDRFDNETSGMITFNLNRSSVTTVNSSTVTITARDGMTIENNTSGPISIQGDSFATEALCTVNAVVQTNATIMAVQVDDSFGATSINRAFTIGSGS